MTNDNNVSKEKAKLNTKDFLKLDYNVKHLDERLNLITDLLKSDIDECGRNHFESYFDDFYRANINTDKPLSDKLFACRVLESMASYLLGSIEVREERKNGEIKYYFYVNKEEFHNRVKKEIFTRDVIGGTNTEKEAGIEANILHFLNKKSMSNHKKDKRQAIFNSDYQGDELVNEILRQYKSILDRVTYLMHNLDETELKRKQLTAMKKSIMEDMILTKTALCGTFGENLKNALIESTEPSWDCFDYTNTNHIKYALRIKRELEHGDDLSHISLDMDIVLKKLYKENIITEQQHKVISLIRKGYTNKDVEEVVKIHNSRVVHIVDAVAKKIAKYYQSLE